MDLLLHQRRRPSFPQPSTIQLPLSLHLSLSHLSLSLLSHTPHSLCFTELAALAIADSTFSTYSSHFRQYNTFCEQRNLFPLSLDSLHSFIFYCYAQKFSFGKANGTVAAVSFWCKLNGIPTPNCPLTSLGLRAYRKHYKLTRPPVWYTVQDLNTLLSTISPLQLHHSTLLTLSFYTLIRPKEILHLKWSNAFLEHQYIWLTYSKTDQEGAGTYVKLLPPALNALNTLSTAVSHSPSDLIFPINQSTLNDWLITKCKQANVPQYTWYALKHGGATFLALSGWTLAQIQAHGRWKTTKAALIYIHAPLLAHA